MSWESKYKKQQKTSSFSDKCSWFDGSGDPSKLCLKPIDPNNYIVFHTLDHEDDQACPSCKAKINIPTCSNCGSQKAALYYDGKGGKGDFDHPIAPVECEDCGSWLGDSHVDGSFTPSHHIASRQQKTAADPSILHSVMHGLGEGVKWLTHQINNPTKTTWDSPKDQSIYNHLNEQASDLGNRIIHGPGGSGITGDEVVNAVDKATNFGDSHTHTELTPGAAIDAGLAVAPFAIKNKLKKKLEERRSSLEERYASDEKEHDHYKYIKHRGNSWVIIQKGTGKVLSHHDTREKAIESFKAMMMNKHGNTGVETSWRDQLSNLDSDW